MKVIAGKSIRYDGQTRCFAFVHGYDQIPRRHLFEVLKSQGLQANHAFIPNYGDRFRYGERIATGFVESTINQVAARRFEKQQQISRTQQGAHLLLQVRAKVLNGEWRDTFGRWCPYMTPLQTLVPLAA